MSYLAPCSTSTLSRYTSALALPCPTVFVVSVGSVTALTSPRPAAAKALRGGCLGQNCPLTGIEDLLQLHACLYGMPDMQTFHCGMQGIRRRMSLRKQVVAGTWTLIGEAFCGRKSEVTS